MSNSHKIFAFFILVLFLARCKHDHDHGDAHSHDEPETKIPGNEHMHGEAAHVENEVHLTANQVATIGLKTGTFQTIKTGGFVKTNGVLDLPPDEYATLSAPAKGFVKATQGEYLVGSYVKKGTVLASLEHPDYIQMQQHYLEVEADLEFQEQEVERQQTLNETEAGVLKKLQEAESKVKGLKARKEGLRQQLKYLGISAEQVEQGKISSIIYLKAPISGYITALNIHEGKFVRPEETLYEIVNNHHIHLELDVFEKDIARVKTGQKITFTIPSLGNEVFEGEVKLVGKSFNMENKTVRVHGHINGKHPEFIRGFYLEAKIWTNQESVKALPSEAVILEEGMHYIFVQEREENGETVYKRVPVKTGYKEGDLVEVRPLEPVGDDAAIVLEEAFFLYASLNKGEHAHHH